MLKEQCISVTDLRTRTKEYLENLKEGEKYIFVNNKPRAVLMDIDEYEENFVDYRLRRLPEKEITPTLREKMQKASKMDSNEFLNL